LLLDKVYDHIWGFSRALKKAFAQEIDASEHVRLAKKLTDFEEWQRKKDETEIANLVQVILVDIELFYSGKR
jgi:hypothetical protein